MDTRVPDHADLYDAADHGQTGYFGSGVKKTVFYAEIKGKRKEYFLFR